jgi:Rieske [2Fe-2S] domain
MTTAPDKGRASEMMWKFWYPALRSEQVRRHKLARAMLLDVPLVLGRDTAGKPFALRDVCPHRAPSWKLSADSGIRENAPSCCFPKGDVASFLLATKTSS